MGLGYSEVVRTRPKAAVEMLLGEEQILLRSLDT